MPPWCHHSVNIWKPGQGRFDGRGYQVASWETWQCVWSYSNTRDRTEDMWCFNLMLKFNRHAECISGIQGFHRDLCLRDNTWQSCTGMLKTWEDMWGHSWNSYNVHGVSPVSVNLVCSCWISRTTIPPFALFSLLIETFFSGPNNSFITSSVLYKNAGKLCWNTEEFKWNCKFPFNAKAALGEVFLLCLQQCASLFWLDP